MDTIYALATAPGRAGVAIVRVSGTEARNVCRSLAGDVPDPRMASLRRLRHQGDVIDEALTLFFPKGASFTGEDVVEFQTHGSPAVISRISRVLSGLDRVRAAEPGEFTRRALENGRLNLAEVEGLADLIDAETEAQRVQAFRTFDGDLGRQVETWRRDLIRAAALVEASIDFADEEVPEDVVPEVTSILQSLVASFRSEVNGVGVAERIRSGFEVAIVGPPNVGKSTLLNRLAGREAAIISEFAGTTRDVIEVRMDVSGMPVTFLDTAGVRETDDAIEALGVERALERARAADIRVVLGSVSDELSLQPDDIVLVPKSDQTPDLSGMGISGLTGDGVSPLMEHISRILSGRVAETGVATRIRHKEALTESVDALEMALWSLSSDDIELELSAESIRIATRKVDSLVGRIGVEDLLGEIFSSFCIGK
ncbi:tRNA uridine-5-carboxymethylaminomethyl(34) synthesis GTPase MnmE [Tropicimonas sp. TH_r6]|uniref:tRNA uridine-5-carboxymethylaminomethyl(34) synthesis GTPase MnmE n=1 Tax=Tropicimonas sp. TH_r6 TaxID=3082085 RepID=UPI002954984A|nr:tRNA uridine-5-carboxymethylaminomethyl(34) synthesis GTPase MnmE [Tropicimonas sp. TH_r6]MDV7141277.1 tRNA uridine-5-carboxymethylaminomethyl(34) synthesis GTPase MnmE [Tropicimonas sp. TH_r6]